MARLPVVPKVKYGRSITVVPTVVPPSAGKTAVLPSPSSVLIMGGVISTPENLNIKDVDQADLIVSKPTENEIKLHKEYVNKIKIGTKNI